MKLYKNLKEFIFTLIKLGLIVFLVITLNRIFMPKYIFENQDGRITQEYYPKAKDTDVIFVGSSTVHSGIDPRVLMEEQGISAYLRANASQPMWISYYMIEDALRWHTPELVCIDTTFIKYGDDFVEEPSTRKALDGMRLTPSKIKCIKASMGEDEKMADYIMPLFRFHTRWKELTLDDFKYAYYNKPVTVNGYLPDDEVEAAEPGELIYTREGDTTLSPKNVEYLRRAIEECHARGVQVMIFKVPAHSPNWSRDYDDQINEIAKEYGLSYINFDDKNDEIGLDYSTDTPDGGSHLNTSGAGKFSRYLGDYIRANYTVSDRRQDT